MDVFRLATAFLIVFGLLGILWASVNLRKRRPARLWGVKLWNPSNLKRRGESIADALSIIQQVRLTPTHQLHLLASGQERFLVCTHPHGCTSIPLATKDCGQRQSPEWPGKGLNDAA